MSALAFVTFLSINIDINPVMADFGPFTLTWHGLFTAVGIIAGVSLSVWLAKKDGIPAEVAQEVALVGVPSAIVGARLFYVFEHWGRFSDDPIKIVTGITEGGITLYGGLLGGVLGGLVYSLWHKWPIGILFDAAAPGMILGQGLGRIGDLINGEHLADRSGLPWAVKYLHPDSPQYQWWLTHQDPNDPLAPLDTYAVHPVAGGYELVGDFIILAILLFVARRFIRVPGWVFCSYVGMYGIMRFALSYFRFDEQTIGGVPVPQLTSGILIGIAVIAAGILYRKPGPITREYAERVWGDLPLPGETEDSENAPSQA
ncbi:MAG TPA: prolipoprotein diacylglyceryl transferase [Thermoanaerobaculia bacterium]